jgi:hypothetical protein
VAVNLEVMQKSQKIISRFLGGRRYGERGQEEEETRGLKDRGTDRTEDLTSRSTYANTTTQ